jgi:DNA-binding beta-propeller fold protein YncE
MTVPKSIIRRLVAASALLAGASAAHAQGVSMTHAASIYSDDKQQSLKAPEGVACAANGSVVVADTGNGRLVTYVVKEGVIDGGNPITIEQVPYPTRVQFEGDGKVVVLDRRKKRLARIDLAGKFLGYVEVQGASSSDVIAAFTLDAARNLYVVDVTAAKVWVLDPGGAVTRQIEIPRTAMFMDVAVDSLGTVYAVDALGGMIWSCDKAATTFKPFTKSLKDVMSFPASITAAKGRFYVVDQNGSGVVVLAQDGAYLGRRLAIGWADGLVRYPSQLCITDAGEAILADRQNNRVQVFTMK